MLKTQNYNLNKPEVTDPMRVADFNENADIIDAVLKEVSTAVGTKAEQSEVDGLNTLLSTKARLETGSYKGTGGRGSANKNALTFRFEPSIVGIAVDAKDVSNGAAIFVRGQSKCSGTCKDALNLIVNWTGNTVTWYDDSNGAASDQLNSDAYTYFYFAIG